MNVLILHHFSDYWEEGMKNAGTNYEEVLSKVLDYIRHEDINKVLLPLFEKWDFEDCHAKLRDLCYEEGIEIEAFEYGYGWRREDEEYDIERLPESELGKTWCYGTRDNHGENDVIEIQEWQHELKNVDNVIVAGAFENECVFNI